MGGGAISARAEDAHLKHADSIVNNLALPIAVVTQDGETASANRALMELAERCKVRPNLTDLFGAAFSRVLSRAWIERHIQTTAPLICGPEPRETYRLSFATTEDAKTLAVLMQDVTAELESRRALAERERDLAVLRDVGAILSGPLEIDALAERTHEATRRAIACNSIYIAVFDHETEIVSFPRYQEEGEWKEMTSRPLGQGLTEHLLRTCQPLLLNENVLEQARALGIEPQGRPCQSWLGAPMVVDGEAIGAVAAQDYQKTGAFQQRDLDMLTAIAAQAAAGIRNAHSVAAERRAFRESAEAQARMLETERLRGVTETVGALNHEINNPLTAIAGNSQLLLKKPEGIPVAALQKIESIHDSAKRIQRVTGKMASLIQACSMAYPGEQSILDVDRSSTRETAGKDEPEAGEAAA